MNKFLINLIYLDSNSSSCKELLCDIRELPGLYSRVCCHLNFLAVWVGHSFDFFNSCNLSSFCPALIPNRYCPADSILNVCISVVESSNNLSLNFLKFSICKFREFRFDELVYFLIRLVHVPSCPTSNNCELTMEVCF